MASWIRYKYSTKDIWGKLRYKIKTIKLEKLPTDCHGYINVDECSKLAREAAKRDPAFYGMVWHQTS